MLPDSFPTPSTFRHGLIAVSLVTATVLAQTTVFEADFESSIYPTKGSAIYNADGETASALPSPTSPSSDPTLGNGALALESNDTGLLSTRFNLSEIVSLSGSDTATLSFELASIRTNNVEITTVMTGFDASGQPIFALVLGDRDAFGNDSNDRQRPGYEVAGPVRATLPGAGVPGSYWWGNGGNGNSLDTSKDASFTVTVGNSGWTVATTSQTGATFTSSSIPTYDGTTHDSLAYFTLTNVTGTSFGHYWDNFQVTGTPSPIVLNSYTWTAGASGGDGASLFGENNWSKDADNVTTIPSINAGEPVDADLVIASGTPGGGGATGTLNLGIGSLTVSGGTTLFALGGDHRITHGPLSMTGGTVSTEGLRAVTATLSGGNLVLDTSSSPLDQSTVDFPVGSTATLEFTVFSPEGTVDNLLSAITVEGQPAVNGINIAVTSNGSGGSRLIPFTGAPDGDNDNMADAWETIYFGDTSRDGTADFDNDGLTDLAEFNAGTFPNHGDSDDDLIADGAETTTDPANRDSDGDGNPDGFELAKGLDPNDPASKIDRPNILYIFCDDLGYGDIGVLHQNSKAGKKHKTPFLDAMANQGLILDRHYCPAPVCAPSRGSLFTGMHQGHANIRDNQFDKALENNHTLATTLRTAGYRTALVGKYGLQGGGGNPVAWPAYPTKRGFNEFFGYVRHADGHVHYPDYEWPLGNSASHRSKKELYDGEMEMASALDKCFTPDLFTAKAKQMIIDEHGDGDNEPFFILLAYDTPHAALQLPTVEFPGRNPSDDDDDSGFGISGGLQWTGIESGIINTAIGTEDSYIHPDYAGESWTDVEKRQATLIRRMDDCVGDLRKTLADLGIEDETLIVFSADNGPHSESYIAGVNYQPSSFQSYGPFEGIKRDCWEGGIRQPTLVCWPGTIPAGSTNEMPAQLHDWLATLSTVAGLTPPARTDGVDLTPTLTGTGSQKPTTTYIEYTTGGSTPTYSDFTNHGGTARTQSQVIFVDDYKGIRSNPATADTDFEIYDTRLTADPTESNNLAINPPAGQETYFVELQQRMKDRVLRIRQPDSSASRPYMDSTPVPPVTPGAVVNGVEWKSYSGFWPWIPEFTTEAELGNGTSASPDLADLPAGPMENGLLYTGYISIPTTGTWTFSVQSDSGAFLRIHDIMVLDDDFKHDGSVTTGTVLLEAGMHPYRIYYRNRSGVTPQLDITWSGPGTTAEELPASALFIEGTPDPEPIGIDDDATTAVGSSILIDVLANDIDDGLPNPLSITAVAAPTSGTTAIENNQVRYTPAAGYAGTDQFEYTLTDGQFTTTARVTVTLVFPISNLWVPFNEGQGTVVHDAGGTALGAQANSGPGPAWNDSPNGLALAFDGVDDFIPVNPAIYTPPLGSTPRTVTAWIKVPDASSSPTLGSLVSWGSNTGANGGKWHFRLENAAAGIGTLRVEVKGGYLRGSTDLRDNQWHHVALVFPTGGSDVTDCLLYVDGNLETPGGSTPEPITTNLDNALAIGVDDQNRYFEGLIDELRIYSSALSGPDITDQANDRDQAPAAWHARYFGDAVVDWNADDDNDGLPRLLEYAFVGNPHVTSSAPLPQLSIEDDTAYLTFSKPDDQCQGVDYTFEQSEDLLGWTSFEAIPDEDEPGPLPCTETVKFEAGTATPVRRFLRVRVDLRPTNQP
ncbi:sulfatase-like hydrolase/transferase [Haloferula rosea]|uniref:Sulfatase-like hydrolase/transferase n=1 Tax=Haloferula rosea TaxID=490093 RepID=A0A934R890_9BACT|nr:sulfatase-like hydrolase/transferase [Haloferula rosea]MBK1825773.1 sulfatase-like hydrolase/transferase [Haloferula rosea]